jgi:hypothetical protein
MLHQLELQEIYIESDYNSYQCTNNFFTRRQHRQLVFPPQYEDSKTRLRTFLNRPNIYGVAYFVAECLALFP